MVFLRVRVLQVDLEDVEPSGNEKSEPYCAVNVLETVQLPSKFFHQAFYLLRNKRFHLSTVFLFSEMARLTF